MSSVSTIILDELGKDPIPSELIVMDCTQQVIAWLIEQVGSKENISNTNLKFETQAPRCLANSPSKDINGQATRTYVCTRKKPHEGPHVGHNSYGNILIAWGTSDSVTKYLPKVPNDQDMQCIVCGSPTGSLPYSIPGPIGKGLSYIVCTTDPGHKFAIPTDKEAIDPFSRASA